MDKLKMHTPNLADENFTKLSSMFPNAVTETMNEDGDVVRAIDVDVLQQEISGIVIAGGVERYQFTWPDKKKSVVLANQPINKTLRLCKEKSVGCDSTMGNIDTENIYIEGDNLDALKLLQETYLGKVKMIYIDPPYNTGNDFIYVDDFSQSHKEYFTNSGQTDYEGNRLVQNSDSNGRFHTDWLNMIYPRLRLAKDLLSDDGVIFISIDENECDKMKLMCDEIFGCKNYRNQLLVRRRIKSLNVQFADKGLNSFNVAFEYVLVYSKSQDFLFNPLRVNKEYKPEKGSWNVFWSNADRPTMRYDVLGFTPKTGQWRWQKDLAEEAVKNYIVYEKEFSEKMTLEDYWISTGKNKRFIRRISNGTGKNGGVQCWVPPSDDSLRTSNWTDIEVTQIAKGFDLPFDNPKNVNLIKTLVSSVRGNDFIVLDFFSGSGTTADAVLRLNAEDHGKRKWILVQIPEPISLTRANACYKNICDVGEERIRMAGNQIKEEHPSTDVGFRVFKIDSSNMYDVYYKPDDYTQEQMDLFACNIKEDRTPEDLLFQVMIDLGVELSSKIEEQNIYGKKVFVVGGGYTDRNSVIHTHLIACFDDKINDDTVKAIAEKHPAYAVFRDSGMENDSVATNFDQIFETYSPETVRKVL